MKLKKTLIAVLAGGILLLSGALIAHNMRRISTDKGEGFATKENVNSFGENRVMFEGKRTSITSEQINQRKLFYMATGVASEQKAEELALENCKETMSLYSEAVDKHYTVTEEEVAEYVKNLRDMFSSEDVAEESKRQYESIVANFGSEDEYWQYEEQLYQTLLPIQKMNEDLEKEFFEKHPDASDEDWTKEFESMKAELVRQENFVMK